MSNRDGSELRRIAIIKKDGKILIGKLPQMLDTSWEEAWSEKKILYEEEESEVEDSDDETEKKAGWAVRAAERRLRSRLSWSAKNRKRRQWIIKNNKNKRMLGQAEGVQSKYVLLTKENDSFEARQVDDWVKFKPEIHYRTLSGEIAEKALQDLSVSYDVKEAVRLTRAVQKQQDSTDLKHLTRPISRFERLERKLQTDDETDEYGNKKGAFTKTRTARIKTSEIDPFADAGTRLDIGLNAAGADADAEDIIEGFGDDGVDFDINDDFQDDDADEEIPDLNDNVDLPSDEDENVNDEDEPASKPKKKISAENSDEENLPQDEQSTEEKRARDFQVEQPPPTKRLRHENTGLLTQAEVIQEIQAHNGRFKLRDLLNLYKPRIKQLAANKDAIKRILKQICDMSDDPVEGRVLVLKDIYRRPLSSSASTGLLLR
uniref:Transcription initiation factor IIF subunit alpha n=1 Tax=Aureoumbra lagunensis TaxID=44058 RepID=A0A7S3NII2_9STRA